MKRRIAERVSVEARTLPYRAEVLTLIRDARTRGRRIVLATASDEQLARAVAEHLGIFDAVLASDGRTNLKGAHKLRAIEADAGPDGFEYVGDASSDLPIWGRSKGAVLVAPGRGTSRQAERLDVPVRHVSPVVRNAGALLRGLRPHQWVKNLLVFVPLLLAHRQFDLERLLATVGVFMAFCACASGTYLLNDLMDLEADRAHPIKQRRPLASGSLSIPMGLSLAAMLVLGSLAGALWLLGPVIAGMLGIYVFLTLLYSLSLKEKLFLDVLVLAGLFTHRVLTGAMAADVVVSPWLLAFSMFIFLSLAALKRYAELLSARGRDVQQVSRRGYEVADLELVQTVGLTSGYLAVLVIGLYVSSSDVRVLYPRPEILWLVCPLLLYWVSRLWFLARRGLVSEDPVLYAATDRASYVVGALVLACGILAAWNAG
jgi:4-hydroxybenzoate polyprenyltransferase